MPTTMRRLPRAMREAPQLDPAAPTVPTKPRHALLINPFYAKDPHASFGKHVLTPTLALTSVAGATPRNWTVAYWDENLLQGPPPTDPFPQVVGISVHLTFARRAFELAGWYRQRGAIVVLGGLHVLSNPDDCRPHADALAIGEGVQLWPRILEDVDRGVLTARGAKPDANPESKATCDARSIDPTSPVLGDFHDSPRMYEASFRRPYRDEPAPRRDILPRESFLTTSSLIATRGCHNRCGFCYLATDGLDMPYQCRDADQIVEEFLADDQPYAVFTDNNLGSRPEYLRELCRALRPIEKIWSAAVSIDVTDDPSLVREMALAGCTGVFVGFESLTDRNIQAARKKSPSTEDYARRVQLLHDHGIQVNGSFVLGFDHDDRDVFARTTSWVEDNRLECATFHILTPYPGTPLFRQMQSEGRILHQDWDRYDTANVVFRPRHMSPEELHEGYRWCYRRLFSSASIWRRRPESWRAVLPYLGMAYLYKRANWLWPLLIRHRWTARMWRPLVELTRRRHVAYRRRLTSRVTDGSAASGTVVAPGV